MKKSQSTENILKSLISKTLEDEDLMINPRLVDTNKMFGHGYYQSTGHYIKIPSATYLSNKCTGMRVVFECSLWQANN